MSRFGGADQPHHLLGTNSSAVRLITPSSISPTCRGYLAHITCHVLDWRWTATCRLPPESIRAGPAPPAALDENAGGSANAPATDRAREYRRQGNQLDG